MASLCCKGAFQGVGALVHSLYAHRRDILPVVDHASQYALGAYAFRVLFNHLWWILGGFIGALAGSSVTIGLTGLDFVLTSLFAMLTAEQWRNRKTALSLWVALFGYAAARVLMPENALAVSIALCAAAGLVWGASRRKRDSGNCVLNKEA